MRAQHVAIAALAGGLAISGCKGRFKLPADARFVTAIALADDFGCARMKDGSVRAWGANESGELGGGTTAAQTESARVLGSGAWATVAAGGKHACAASAEGDVFCWGELEDGSRESRATPVRVPNVQAKKLALGAHHSCAITPTGDVVCWGSGAAGQLGGLDAGSTIVRGATYLAAGGDATCAILSDRSLSCWGAVPARGVLPVTRIEGLADVVHVAVSATHVCAVRAWGGIACWGSDEEGELGDGAFTERAVPADVVGLVVPARAVAVGRAHTCALLRNDTVHCWGADGRSQLADGANTHRASPLLVNGLFEIEELAAAGDATCARFSDGSERCWGGLSLPKTDGQSITVPTEVRW
ncbi:MAG: RCC1 domain-containing protein [Polyangiaceae bacterium]